MLMLLLLSVFSFQISVFRIHQFSDFSFQNSDFSFQFSDISFQVSVFSFQVSDLEGTGIQQAGGTLGSQSGESGEGSGGTGGLDSIIKT